MRRWKVFYRISSSVFRRLHTVSTGLLLIRKRCYHFFGMHKVYSRYLHGSYSANSDNICKLHIMQQWILFNWSWKGGHSFVSSMSSRNYIHGRRRDCVGYMRKMCAWKIQSRHELDHLHRVHCRLIFDHPSGFLFRLLHRLLPWFVLHRRGCSLPLQLLRLSHGLLLHRTWRFLQRHVFALHSRLIFTRSSWEFFGCMHKLQWRLIRHWFRRHY